MLLSVVYEKAQLQHFKTVANHGKFEAPIYKTSERKGVLSTSHLVQPVLVLKSRNRDELRYSATRILRRSLLQLHHVSRDSPLLQWCPQKLGGIQQYIQLCTFVYYIYPTYYDSSLLGFVCLCLWIHCEYWICSFWADFLRWGVLDQARSCPHFANRWLDVPLAGRFRAFWIFWLFARNMYTIANMYCTHLIIDINRWSLSLFLLCRVYWTDWTIYCSGLLMAVLVSCPLRYMWDQMQTFLAFAKGVVHAETCQCAKLLWHQCRCNTKVFARQSRALLETMHVCHFSAAWVYHQRSRRYDKYTRLQPDIAHTCQDLLGVFLMCCQL